MHAPFVSVSHASRLSYTVLLKGGGNTMKKISNNIFKLSSSVAALALAIGLSTVNSACVFWFNQPKMPESMNKLSKDI